jgi:response regulator of citrate/malate metabolism
MSAPKMPPVTVTVPLQSRRVLVVDDDFMLAKVYGDLLRRIPNIIPVGAAYDGRTALAMIDELRPDLVLLDVYLPDINGLEVLRQNSLPGRHQTDVIVITAASDGHTVLRALRSGAMSYLVKPIISTALNEVVQEWLAKQPETAKAVSSRVMEQPEVDRLVSSRGLVGTPRNLARPKGIAAPTLTSVVQVLRTAQQDLSAREVSEQCGLSRVSARRYLQYLVKIGAVAERLQYGSTGRPEHRYVLVKKDRVPTLS